MFGKKKADAGKAAGGEKKAKRKSRGSGNGAAQLKTFFAENIEKIVLGAVALVALYLVYSGFSKDRLQTGPEAVGDAIASARSRMTALTWSQVKAERVPEEDTFDQRATLDSEPVSLDAYAITTPFHPRLREPDKLRPDPTLLPPIELEVHATYGGLAIKSKDEERSSFSALAGESDNQRPIPAGVVQSRGGVSLGGSYESEYFVSIVGLVPYKEQFDLYGQAFIDAAEYETERDVPRYVGLRIERAEVQPDGSLSTWTDLEAQRIMLEEPERWEGNGEEIAASKHLIPELVMKIPPFVLKNVGSISIHSTVPTGDELRAIENANRQRAAQEAGDVRNRGRRGERDRSEDERAAESADVDAAVPLLDVDRGMFRFFDMTVEAGKTYAYRASAILEDPNNPFEGDPPSEAACETSVLIRRQSAQDNTLETPFSEPSKPVFISDGTAVFAGKVESPRKRGKRVEMYGRATDEPRLTMLVLDWDPNNVYEVPIEVNVGRGAILNGEAADVEVISPKIERIETIPNYAFDTDAIVLDIMGGESLGGELRSPGYALIWQGGQLEFRSEFGDLPSYETNAIPPDPDLLMQQEEEAQRAREAAERERNDNGRRRGRRNNNDAGEDGPPLR